MGIDASTLQFLTAMRGQDVSFSRFISLGRQDVLISSKLLSAVLNKAGLPCSEMEAARLLSEEDRFAEPVLRMLGAERVDSMDKTGFEGATIHHDLNMPLPDELKAKYSLVFDGGTLEHVADFLQAIRTCMEMVEVGGHFIGVSPCNNFMGHGFYQFSPELFYRVFAKENGFVVEKMLSRRAFDESATWWEVVDPAVAGSRVEYNPLGPTFLFVLAKRIRACPILETMPFQSDYAAEWNSRPDKAQDPNRLGFYREDTALIRHIKAWLPQKAKHFVRCCLAVRRDLRKPDARFFKEVEL